MTIAESIPHWRQAQCSLLCFLAPALLPLTAVAQSLETTDRGYVWQKNGEYIRFDRGRWSAGITGKGELNWHMFLWHDQWIYETLPGGKIEKGPSLEADGNLVMEGTFSAREGSSPVKYVCRVAPGGEGLHVRCELRKTGPLKLVGGIFLHVSASRDALPPSQRVWLAPSAQGTLSSVPDAAANRVLLELDRPRSLCFDLPGYRAAESEGGKRAYTFRVNLVPSDFEADQTAVAEYTVGFADMPEHFPGQIEPARDPLAIRSVTPKSARAAQYERVELEVDLGATYENPFDPDEVRLDAVFTSPSGRKLVVPGFFAVAHRREPAEGAEVMVPESEATPGNGNEAARQQGSQAAAGVPKGAGRSGWRVRFAPQELGNYRWHLQLRDRSGEITGGEGSLECVAGKRPGFIRTSKIDPHYLAFDNGEGYFAIGHNLPIYHTTGQLGDEAMRKFAAAKENFNRWWMSSSGFGIEWTDRLGWYRQDVAARIDMSLDQAAELGLYYMMCMDTHQDFRESGWERNPFNARNGGPCQTPREWFTDETARRHYRNRLRYTVARWGYSTHVLCWEFGNEMEGWADSPDEVKRPWHEEMSDYLRSIDPFGHLITTSFWSKTGPEEYWKLKSIDIVQTHCYTNDDGNTAEAVRSYCLHQWDRFSKPHIFGEFGIRSHSTTADKDPQGWALHNSLWAGLTSLSAGGPMPWWHENYIDPLDLYFHFTSLADFSRDLPLGTARWTMLRTTRPEYLDANRPPDTRDVVIATLSRWGKPEHAEFVVHPDGTIGDGRQPQQLLHGQSHQDIKNPPTFLVTYPAPGKFIVRVGRVSSSGLLKIWIDDQLKLEHELPCGEGLGKESVYRPQWKLWETTYDKDVQVDVPAGPHRIRVENFGRDWVTTTGYRFTGCQVLDRPNVLVCGMKSDLVSVLWIQNRESSWYNHGQKAVAPVDGFRLGVTTADGSYDVEWWETWKGQTLRSEQIEARDGVLPLELPRLETDIALKIRKR